VPFFSKKWQTLRPQNMESYNYIYHFGRYLTMLRQAIRRPEKVSMYWRETLRQMNDIGVGSLIIVCLISVFIGGVSALQFAYQLDGQLIPKYYIGYIVRDLAIIELAPTFTCLVLAGKVGSNMAAEIGGMRQKEHIDAMEVMGVNTAAYLIAPKLIAALLTVPILVTWSAFVANLGGYAASVPTGYLTDDDYLRGLRSFFAERNVTMMYVKAVTYGFILTSVSCYQGYFVKGGSIELGQASTRAVVYSSILILLADYLIVVLLAP
jgi:phospholipid/cholesterol/gamma-HCH transport system permease protein